MKDKEKKPLKPFPRSATDEDAERFVDTADLSEYDLSGFRPMRFEFENGSSRSPMVAGTTRRRS